MKTKITLSTIFAIFIIAALALWYQKSENTKSKFQDSYKTILSPREAFDVSAYQTQDEIWVDFKIAKNHFLYKDKLKISLFPKSAIKTPLVLPSGMQKKLKNGRIIGILADNFIVKLPLNMPISYPIKLIVKIQGCDIKNICYPPYQYNFEFTHSNSDLKQDIVKETTPNFLTKIKQAKSYFYSLYKGGIGSKQIVKLNIFWIILLFFLAGIAISLTPCMYPLYPIALSTIMGTSSDNNSSSNTKQSTIKLVLCYIHGMALIYVSMGVIAGFTGRFLITIVQTAPFMLSCAFILLILGMAMFDLIEIKLPNKLQGYLANKVSNVQGGKYVSAFIIGILSSLLLGPCITPPLIAVIGIVASEGSVLIGILALYSIAVGIGMPILVLATVGNQILPKSGHWMNIIKYFLGIILIIDSIYIAIPFINVVNNYVSVGLLFLIFVIIFLIIKHIRAVSLDMVIHKVIPIIMLIIGLIFIVYGLKYNNSLHANKSIDIKSNNINQFVTEDIESLNKFILNSKTAVIIDIYASWCTICQEMEEKVLKDEEVQNHFKSFTVIKFDITKNEPKQLQVLDSYGLYGPPAIIILNKQHKVASKLLGFVEKDTLLKNLDEYKD